MTAMNKPWFWTTNLAFLLCLGTPLSLAAQTYTVSTNVDIDLSPITPGASNAPISWSSLANYGGTNYQTLRAGMLYANYYGAPNGDPTSAPTQTVDVSQIANQIITLGSALPMVFNNLTVQNTGTYLVTIDGGTTSTAGSGYRGFFLSGLPQIATDSSNGTLWPITVTLQNLSLQNMAATGGASAGGGMGAGGALFVNTSVTAVLNGVTFGSTTTGNTATGGGGGGGYGGGGGMGGDGGYGGGGGGLGAMGVGGG